VAVVYTETGTVREYRIHFRWMYQFSNTQRYVTTAGYDGPQSPATVNDFYSSVVRLPFTSQEQFVYCSCFLRAFSWVFWCCLWM